MQNLDTGITVLTDDEVAFINGGLAPLAWAAATAARCAASSSCRTAVKVTALAVAGAVSTAVGYENNKE